MTARIPTPSFVGCLLELLALLAVLAIVIAGNLGEL